MDKEKKKKEKNELAFKRPWACALDVLVCAYTFMGIWGPGGHVQAGEVSMPPDLMFQRLRAELPRT